MKKIILLLTLTAFLFSATETITYYVKGMMCSKNCPIKIHESLINIDGIKSCKVDYKSKTTTITFDNTIIHSDKIANLITEKTYYQLHDINNNKGIYYFWNWLFQ